MHLSLTEQFTLIALNDEKGSFVSDSTYLNNGLAGATLLELALNGRVDWKDNIIKTIDDTPMGNPILDKALQVIRESKPRKIGHWIGVLNANARDIKDFTLNTLCEKEIIQKEGGKRLWIFSYNKYPTKNDQPESKIREKIKDIVLGVRNPNEKDMMLLGLIDVCQLRKEAFRDKIVLKKAREWYKKRNADTEVTKAIKASIQELEAAILAATFAAVMASTTAAT